jgi:hypothetical protein
MGWERVVDPEAKEEGLVLLRLEVRDVIDLKGMKVYGLIRWDKKKLV